MLIDTMTTAASLRPRSESPFVLPTGAFWQLPMSNTGAQGDFGFARVTSSRNAAFMVITPPVGAGVRFATKQDRPPRGMLR